MSAMEREVFSKEDHDALRQNLISAHEKGGVLSQKEPKHPITEQILTHGSVEKL